MKVISWNVNGLRAILKKGFKEWIAEENPDILCIQETKLQENQLTEEIINIGNYKAYYSFAEKKGYSGVATYTKVEPIAVRHGIGIDKFDCEGRILITEFEDFQLLNIYFPNGQSSDERLNYKLEFYEALLSFCNEEIKSEKRLIICGDYNTAHKEIDIKNAKANEKTSGFLPIERAWLDKLTTNGYTDVYRYQHTEEIKYSWWSYMFKARERNVGWRIDYHFVSNNMLNHVTNSDILTEVIGSDHCPVTVEFDFKESKNK